MLWDGVKLHAYCLLLKLIWSLEIKSVSTTYKLQMIQTLRTLKININYFPTHGTGTERSLIMMRAVLEWNVGMLVIVPRGHPLQSDCHHWYHSRVSSIRQGGSLSVIVDTVSMVCGQDGSLTTISHYHQHWPYELQLLLLPHWILKRVCVVTGALPSKEMVLAILGCLAVWYCWWGKLFSQSLSDSEKIFISFLKRLLGV